MLVELIRAPDWLPPLTDALLGVKFVGASYFYFFYYEYGAVLALPLAEPKICCFILRCTRLVV